MANHRKSRSSRTLKAARTKLGLSQPEFATLISTTKQNVSNWETDRVKIPGDVAIRAVEILNPGVNLPK